MSQLLINPRILSWADSKERNHQILSVMNLNKEYCAAEIAELVGLKGSRT